MPHFWLKLHLSIYPGAFLSRREASFPIPNTFSTWSYRQLSCLRTTMEKSTILIWSQPEKCCIWFVIPLSKPQVVRLLWTSWSDGASWLQKTVIIPFIIINILLHIFPEASNKNVHNFKTLFWHSFHDPSHGAIRIVPNDSLRWRWAHTRNSSLANSTYTEGVGGYVDKLCIQ